MIRLLSATLLLVLVLTLLARSQEAEPGFAFEVYTSTRSVTCLAPGLVGTTGGLRRTGVPRVELPGVAIRGIASGWLATGHGLYQGGALFSSEPASAVVLTPSGLVTGHPRGRVKFWDGALAVTCPTSAPIHSLAWDGQRLWAASLDGLWEISPGGARRVSLSRDPLTSTLTALVASEGVVLAGTPAGVYRRQAGEWTRLPGALEVSALALQPTGEALVGTAGRGLFREEADRLIPVEGSPAEVSALLWTPEGVVVGTPRQGAWIGDRGRWNVLYSWQDEVPGNHITALACSPERVCAGTFQDGLGILTTQGWTHALPAAWVNQVACGRGGLRVRTSDGSVVSGDGRSWDRLGRRNGWPKDWTSALGEGWVGTYSGFYLEEGGRWKVFRPKPELQGVMVTDVARWDGQIWAASQSGLFQVDPRTSRCRRHLDGLTDSWVTAVESYGGRLWAGTFSGGLCALDRADWRHYRAGTSPLPSDRIHCLLATSEGLWIGTPRGLVWTDGSRWACYTRGDGLPSDTVWSLGARGDELWVGTDSGLCRASQRRLANGRAEGSTARRG